MNDQADFARCERVELRGHEGEIFHIRFGNYLSAIANGQNQLPAETPTWVDLSLRKSTAPAPNSKRAGAIQFAQSVHKFYCDQYFYPLLTQ